MGEKHVSLRHEGGLRFVATTDSGHDVVVDNGTGDTGPRPTELLLAAIAACTAARSSAPRSRFPDALARRTSGSAIW